MYYTKVRRCACLIRLAGMIAVWAATALTTNAQITNARLSGSIKDVSGAVVPGVRLTIQNKGTNLSQAVESTEDGTYSFKALPTGTYTLTAVRAGFATDIEENVVLTVGQSATLDINLKAGGSEDTVTVTGGTALINTTTAEISQVIGESAIKDLPLNGRDPSGLVYLSAGVTDETISQAASTQTNQSFGTQTGASAGGGRQGSTWYLLDGYRTSTRRPCLRLPFRMRTRRKSSASSRTTSMRATVSHRAPSSASRPRAARMRSTAARSSLFAITP